jgi:hypothetical protein
MWRGLNFLEAGHVRDARASFERARTLDPLSGIHLGWIGATLVIAGEPASAEEHLRRAHELGWRGPATIWLLKQTLAEGFGEQAARRYQDWLHDDGRIAEIHRETHEIIAPAIADPAHLERARAALAAAVRSWPESEWTQLYLMLGLTDEAVAEALRSKLASGQILLLMIWSAVDRPFREHPHFLALAEREGLLEFWDRYGDPDHCRRVEGSSPRLECER